MKTKKKEELFNNSNEIIIKELENALEGWQKDFHRVDEENQKLQESKQMWKRSSQLKGLKILGLNSAFDKLKKKIDDLEF